MHMQYVPNLMCCWSMYFLLPRVMYGFTSCLKNGMVGLCGDVYFDLLETTYEEVIVDVIGDAIGCNEEHGPLLGELKLHSL